MSEVSMPKSDGVGLFHCILHFFQPVMLLGGANLLLVEAGHEIGIKPWY